LLRTVLLILGNFAIQFNHRGYNAPIFNHEVGNGPNFLTLTIRYAGTNGAIGGFTRFQ